MQSISHNNVRQVHNLLRQLTIIVSESTRNCHIAPFTLSCCSQHVGMTSFRSTIKVPGVPSINSTAVEFRRFNNLQDLNLGYSGPQSSGSIKSGALCTRNFDSVTQMSVINGYLHLSTPCLKKYRPLSFTR